MLEARGVELAGQHISSALNVPIGSIGPIRARSIAHVQRHSELREIATAS